MDDEFVTACLYESSAINYSLPDISFSFRMLGDRALFVFPMSPALLDAVNRYKTGVLHVQALSYAATIKKMRHLMHVAKAKGLQIK